MTPLETILDKLQGVQRRNGYYTALCPGHDDNRPSLSVREGNDGRVLLKCHAGCETSGVLAAMGLKMADLFPKSKGRGEIEAIYGYHDADGKLAYRVVRFKPKSFACQRPDGAGGWLWNLNGIERIPYHLDELLREPKRLVFIAEGEKSVDAVRGLGLLATCNPNGAGNWRDVYNEPLRGRHVVILPDNDPQGKDHAQDIVRSLNDAAASVRVLELPGLADKEDVADWVARGGNRDALTRLAQAAPMAADWLEALPDDIHRTDWGNAMRLVALHGEDLRYCFPWGKWLIWTSRRWKIDDTGEVERCAKDTARDILLEADNIKDEDEREAWVKWAMASESKTRLKAMIGLATSEPGIPILPDHLDTDPWLLNVQNGTLDLRTGELREHQREDGITKIAPIRYNPDAPCPRWLKFLDEIMAGDEVMVSFLQRAVGYSLTGDVSERALLLLYGSGANGKTVFLEAIRATLGDYALRTPTETLMLKRHGAIPNDIARLRGARFVSASESEAGRRLAEALVKDLTGGDTVTARFLHAEWFDFRPECKVWLATNHKPEIRGTDKAIWDRVKLIPFEVTIPEDKQDKHLADKLKGELPGVLAWAVKGCLDWQKDGLSVNDKVRAATSAYRNEMDILGTFIEECCVEGDDKEALACDLYDAYKVWGGDLSQRKFGLTLGERGFIKDRKTTDPHKGKILWRGIGLGEPYGESEPW